MLIAKQISGAVAVGLGLVLVGASTATAIAAPAPQCQYDPQYQDYRFTGLQASAPGFSCSVGDKTFSGFSGKAVREDLQFIISETYNKHFVRAESNLFNPATTWDLSFDVVANAATIAQLETYAGSDFTGRTPLKLVSSLQASGVPGQALYTENFGQPPNPSTPLPISPLAQTLPASPHPAQPLIANRWSPAGEVSHRGRPISRC